MSPTTTEEKIVIELGVNYSTSTLTVFPPNVIGKLVRTPRGFDYLPSYASRAFGDEFRVGERMAFQQVDDMTHVDAPLSTTTR